ncbi:MAG: ankyrin repeat domain-containing protein, partial [Bryobacteraceae bacterium]
LEWSPAEIKPEDGKRAAPGLNANVGRTPVMLAMKGGGGPPIQGGPGYIRSGPPVFREPGSRDPLEALNVLLAAGASPNAKAPDGSTPLHQAVQAQKVDLIRALAAVGGSLDAVNKDNQTPLILAESMAKKAATTKAPVDTGAPAANRPKKDSPEEVVVALRELMHLGPGDPTPQPPPAAAAKGGKKGSDGQAQKDSPDAP